MKLDAGIELARSRSHRQPVEGGEAQRAFDAASVQKRAHGGPTAQVSDDHPSGGDVGRDLPQTICNILVGQAVESITANPFGVEPAWNCIAVGQRAVAAMK